MHYIIEEDCKRIMEDLGNDIEKLANQNLLLTGSCGFLGSYFMHSIMYANNTVLKGKECTLFALDNFIRGRPEWLKEFENNAYIKIIKHDIVNQLPLDLPKMNYIIHAASIASPTYYRLHPIETMDTNVLGLRNLLDYSVSDKEAVKSFLFFSSSEIYGDPNAKNIPTPEDYRGNVSCTGPRACYDESKRYGETLCVNFYKVYGVPVKIVRPFNNYGPGLKITDGRVIPDFCRNLLNNKNIILLSDGSPIRTFCYVSDAITGYWKILLSNHNGEVFNIGVDKPEISMLELARMVAKIGKRHFSIEVGVKYKRSKDKDYLTDVPNRRCPNISKAKKYLNYNPNFSLNEGLRRTIFWYQDFNIAEKKKNKGGFRP